MDKTAFDINYLAKELFNKINEVRTAPLKMANKITMMMSYINKRDHSLNEPNKPSKKLVEGIKSYEEAITFLKQTEPLEAFLWDDTLGKIALAHASDLGMKGANTSNSSDGKISFQDRFKKCGTFTELNESIVMFEYDPVQIIMNLLICDGEPTRTNRNLILSSTLRQIGIGTSQHVKFNIVTVIDFARNWKVKQGGQSATSPSSSQKKQAQSSLPCGMLSLIPPQKSQMPSQVNLDEVIENYEKEIDSAIKIDDFIERKEESQIIQEQNRKKLIKKVTFRTSDGIEKVFVLSKTWYINSNLGAID